jgi:enoyl-CoA hydratase
MTQTSKPTQATPPTASGRRAPRQSDEIRELLLESARTQFSELGYGGATTKRIASEAGVAEPLLFRHFGSKAAIFEEAVVEPLRRAFEELVRRFATDGYGLRPHDLSESSDYYVTWMSSFLRGQRRSLLALLTAPEDPELESLGGSKSLFGSLFQQLESDVRVEADAGGWTGVDIPVATRIAFGVVACMTLLDDWFRPDGEDDAVSRQRIEQEMARFIANGMARGINTESQPDAADSASSPRPIPPPVKQESLPIPTATPLDLVPAAISSIRVERRGAVAIVTLNRPEQRNVVTKEMHTVLVGLWDQLAATPGIRAVILTGAGDTFSAGADTAWLSSLHDDAEQRRDAMNEARELAERMLACRLPIIAAVNGPAVGMGCTIVSLCDLVLMADTAYIADPHVLLGLVAGDGGAVTWPFMTSLVRAKKYLFTGARIDAITAERFGLANEVVPEAELASVSLALADRMASLPAQALQDTKRALNLHIQRAAGGIMDFAIAAESDTFTTAEHRQLLERFVAEGATAAHPVQPGAAASPQ